MNQYLKFGAIFCLSLAMGLASCKKKDKEEAITSDDAADAVAESMQIQSGGVTESIDASSQYMFRLGLGPGGVFHGLSCGVPFDTTCTRSITGSGVTANYTHTWEYVLNCDSDSHPLSITGTGNHDGTFDGPKINSKTHGTRNWVITGLGSSEPNFIYNGTLNRGGVHTSKVRKKNTFTTTVDVTTTDLLVAKSNRKIVSGNSTVHVTCVSSGGKSVDYTGTLVFNGDNTATLTMNGNTYTITF